MLPGLLALAILASSYFIPRVGAFMLPLLPVPLAYARLRYGSANSLAPSAFLILLVSLTGGFPVVTAVVLGLSVSGYVLGGSLRAGEPDGVCVLKGTLLPVVTVGPLLGVYFLLAGINPWAMLQKAMDQGLKESVDLYRQIGMSQADIDKILPSLKTFTVLFIDYLPAFIVCLTALTSLFCFYLLKRHAVKAGIVATNGTPMNRWVAPDLAVWGIIVPGFLMIPPMPVLRQAGGNLLCTFAMVFFFQGIAVIAFMFEKFKLPFALRMFGVLIIVMQPFLLLFMWCLGLFDTWADFRRIRPKKVSQ